MLAPYRILICWRILLHWKVCKSLCVKLLQNIGLMGIYHELLETCAIPSLEERRTKRQLYNIWHGHCYFPQDIFVHASNHYSTRSNHMVISQPFAHTNSFLYPIPYLCGISCLKSKYLLSPYKLSRNYFIVPSVLNNCHYFTVIVLVCLDNFFIYGYASY